MALKAALLLLSSPAASRRLRQAFAWVESAGLCYRSLLPVPLWYAWLLHAVMHASTAVRVSCFVYATTLVTCFASSTLFHSAFMLGRLRHVFHILDQ